MGLFDNQDDKEDTKITHKIFRSEIKSVDNDKFIVHAIVSDDSVDRYKEKILPDAWKKNLKKYKKHPILVSSHNYGALTGQIGKANKIWIEDNKLHAEFKYFVGEGNQEADWGFKLAQKGIAAFSVGFMPLKSEYEEIKNSDSKIKTYTEVELLEISQVLIPANPQALQKGLDSDDPVIKSMIRDIESMSGELLIEAKLWEDTEKEIKYRIKDPDKFQEGSFKRISIKKDKPRIYGVIGRLKSEKTTTLQALRFPKDDGWDLKGAKGWIKEHPEIKSISGVVLETIHTIEAELINIDIEKLARDTSDKIIFNINSYMAEMKKSQAVEEEQIEINNVWSELKDITRNLKQENK